MTVALNSGITIVLAQCFPHSTGIITIFSCVFPQRDKKNTCKITKFSSISWSLSQKNLHIHLIFLCFLTMGQVKYTQNHKHFPCLITKFSAVSSHSAGEELDCPRERERCENSAHYVRSASQWDHKLHAQSLNFSCIIIKFSSVSCNSAGEELDYPRERERCENSAHYVRSASQWEDNNSAVPEGYLGRIQQQQQQQQQLCRFFISPPKLTGCSVGWDDFKAKARSFVW